MKHCLLLVAVLSAALTSAAGAESSADQGQGPWTVPVLVVKYFPVTADGKNIDIAVTSNVGATLDEIRTKCDQMTAEAMAALEEGSRFRAYNNADAKASLDYLVVDTLEYLEPMPRNAKKSDRPDYVAILQRAGIREYVEEKGVKEVWLWGYHSKEVAPWESNLASPHGDISNSDRDPEDLPILSKTYTVYHYNYERGTSEAVHNHIHQIESIMRHYGGELWQAFEGKPGAWRCGNCHFPPNGKSDYDWTNQEYVLSDIEDWRPEGFGELQRLNCDKWEGDSLKWFIYWMRSMPGAANGLTVGGKPLTDWWHFFGDYDRAVAENIGLAE